MIPCGWSQAERAVRPMRVVVLDVDAQDVFELSAACDQEPVEAIAADGAHPALGERIRVRRAKRCADDLDALALEYLIEGAAEFAVAVGTESGSGVPRRTKRAGGLAELSKGHPGSRCSPQSAPAACGVR
jgi:hypothetical protein